MTFKVFVDGQEGTTGLRIHEYLSQRTDVTLLRIDPERRKDVAARRELVNASDVTFLCLPDQAARESAALVENDRTCVIDASTAHRVDPAWTFGLPELDPAQRDRLRRAKRIANPGCHATAFILAVRPLVARGVLPAGHPVSAHSITGYSGGGRKMIEQYEAAAGALNAPRPYALGLLHKHLPEMRVHAALEEAPIFTPIVGPFYKGLAVTVFVPPKALAGSPSPHALRDLLAEYYEGERFVRVAPFDNDANCDAGFFDVQGSNDTNRVDLFVFGNDERVVVVARLDNLGKGASGAAVQCMNVHLGVAEGLGLE
ncbi:MAG: N-acetyl-gamma-glutamyl-phosphate reductase [Betaproteobacteria bacterium]|nr:N-acetyl-gamma-glutamyl-phosphate reductase [Betaproteobacteria bacterium]